MNIKLIALSTVVLLTTGCASSNYTKDSQGNVAATGWAAITAAGANTSHKEECVGGCRNPGWSSGNNGSSHPNATPQAQRSREEAFAEQMKLEAELEAQRQMRWRIQREIQRAFGRW